MSTCYRFGRVEVRPAERQLLVEGRPAPVGARAFDVLMALIDRRDRVVTKDELLDLVWPGLVVEENNLQVQVSTLRKHLGPRAVATIPGRGYRFTLEPELPDGPTSDLTLPRHNLPAQLNRFIGREHEISELKGLMGTSRLVTLASLGGTGKTRLSLQLAYELVSRFPDGAWFVELAPVADEERVSQAVAAVLGVQEQPGSSINEALLRWVRNRNMLLVLDNCEHLVRATAELVKQLLQAAPGLQVLASSREPLHVGGETVYPLSPLPTPDARYAASTAILEQYDAVQLFVDRAVAANPSFRLTDANVPAVVTVCRRLDGIPLAIELAAARVRALSVENIASRLDDRFRLLTGGDQTAAPRQQTLRASLDWSYELLNEAEAALLRRLAVFAGGWTLEAAESVCVGGEVEAGEVLDLLTHLVEKSLVDIDGYGERYRLLETVRQYALEKFKTSDEAEIVRERHFSFFMQLTTAARLNLRGRDEPIWVHRLDLEFENILSAHGWAGPERGVALISSIKRYCVTRGLTGLAHRMFVEALAVMPKRDLARWQALFDAGQLGQPLGRNAESRKYLEESVAIAEELGNQARIALALQPLGAVCMSLGDVAAARRHLQVALAMALESGKEREIAAALNALGSLHRVLGDNETAEKLYREAVSYARRLEDRETIALILLNLAMTTAGQSCREAAGLVLEAIKLGEQVGSQYVAWNALNVCAGLMAICGSFDRCARLYGAAEAQSIQTGVRRDAADESFLAPLVERSRRELAAAYAAAEMEGSGLSCTQATDATRIYLQEVTDTHRSHH